MKVVMGVEVFSLAEAKDLMLNGYIVQRRYQNQANATHAIYWHREFGEYYYKPDYTKEYCERASGCLDYHEFVIFRRMWAGEKPWKE